MNAQGRGKFRPRRGILTVQVRAPAGGWRAQGGRLVWANPPPHQRLRTGANSLAILLNSRGAQAGEPMPVDGILPSQELFDGQGIAAACLFERQEPAAYGGHHLGLAADHPAFRAWSRQVRNRKGTAVRADDVLGPRTMRLDHGYSHAN